VELTGIEPVASSLRTRNSLIVSGLLVSRLEIGLVRYWSKTNERWCSPTHWAQCA
jgi:hypothetical protein